MNRKKTTAGSVGFCGFSLVLGRNGTDMTRSKLENLLLIGSRNVPRQAELTQKVSVLERSAKG